jgi:hypothetical protein
MLSGNGGHEFEGYSYGNSPHTSVVDNGCIECHMADPYGAVAGGHSMNLIFEYHGHDEDLVEGCNIDDCHDSSPLEDFDRDDIQTDMLALMDELRTELLARDLIDEDDYVVVDEEVTQTEAEAGAIFNFRFVLEDRSNGIHNGDYATDLLQSALDELAAAKQYADRKAQSQW